MASENVEELKTLIKDGYKIISIKFSVDKPNTKEKNEKVQIELVNGKNKRVLSVENDSDFTTFSFHFKDFEDKYGNKVFHYVEDLGAYNKEIEMQDRLSNLPKKDYEISIGNRKLIEPFLSHLIKSEPGQPLDKAVFYIKIHKNSHFKNIDFRDQILIKELDSGNVQFNGHIYDVLYGDNTARFLCQGGPKILHYQNQNFELINSDFQGGAEVLKFISESVGIKINTPFKTNSNERNFTIICPILNLNIPNSFSISDVIFYKSEQSEDDKFIENSNLGKVDYRWNTNNVRAKTIIKAKSFFEAMQIGFSKISRTVDFIRLRVDLTFPFQSKDMLNPLSFNFQKQYSRFELTTQVYCRDNTTKHALINDVDILIGHQLIFQYDPDEYFVGFYEIFKKILSKSQQALTKKESGIISALHWLSLSINTTNKLDKLLYLWNALEFIVSDSKTEKKFNKSDLKAIRNKIKELDLTEKQLEIIDDNIQQINNSPLMVKLYNELSRNNIVLCPNEIEVLRKLRKMRNDVIHGKKINDINSDELEKFTSIIERLLVSII